MPESYCPDDFGPMWTELICESRHDVIDMLSTIEQGNYASETCKCKQPFSRNKKVHEAVCAYIRSHGLELPGFNPRP
jgi:hypothetical protein